VAARRAGEDTTAWLPEAGRMRTPVEITGANVVAFASCEFPCSDGIVHSLSLLKNTIGIAISDDRST
jgi:hypothetical protein